jgi:dihydroorotase
VKKMAEKLNSLLIRGGYIIDPAQGVDEAGNLLITGGEISWRGKWEETPPLPEYDSLDAEGLAVCPGFIDLHCHLREPGFEEKETIATGSLAAARGGFTTICCMPNTDPPLDNKAAVEYVKAKAAEEGVVHVLPIGCISVGREGKELAPMDELASAGVIGFSDDGAPATTSLMRQALEHSRDSGLPVIDHCEDTSLTMGGQVNEGIMSIRLKLQGIPAAAEETIVARDLELAELTGGRLHIAHVSTAGSVELIRRAKEKGVRVTAEATPHHLTLTEEALLGYNTSAKVNPPLRTGRDVAALVRGLKDGVIDIIATDHAPHTGEEKRRDFTQAPFGINGFETALGSLMGLVHTGRLSLSELVARLTCEPAKIIGGEYGRLGTLAIGAPADVTVFAPTLNWVVDTGIFASKGRNTPLAGTTLKGKVVATIYGGSPVYLDETVRIETEHGI